MMEDVVVTSEKLMHFNLYALSTEISTRIIGTITLFEASNSNEFNVAAFSVFDRRKKVEFIYKLINNNIETVELYTLSSNGFLVR